MSEQAPLSVLSPLRRHYRYITAHDASRKGVFDNSLAEEAPVRPVLGSTYEFSLMYTSTGAPVSMANDQDVSSYTSYLKEAPALTIPGGTVCRTVDFPPDSISPMHRTLSLDYGVVLEGEVELVLDSGETRLLKRGDVAVQRQTNHAWRNISKDEWARMLFVLQSAEPLTVAGELMVEDEGGID